MGENMKNIALLTLLLTGAANASNDVKFVAFDQAIETQICLTAVEQGLREAKKVAKKSADLSPAEFYTTNCNGLSIVDFANKYKETDNRVAEESETIYKFKLIDNTFETKVCSIAAQHGYSAAKEFAESNTSLISCNGYSVKSFAKKYSAL